MTRLLLMGLFAIIVNLFSCSGQTKKTDSAFSKEMDDQISQSLEAFANRPIHKDLTEQIIDKASDDDLLQIIFDNLSAKVPEDYQREYEIVMNWNRSRQAIYMIWNLEAEVNNGGFNQFYSNSSGQFYKQVPNALKLVGASNFATLTQRANDMFERENKTITRFQDGTVEGFTKSYEDNPLNALDTEFYNLYQTENLQQIQVDYIRNNKKDFID